MIDLAEVAYNAYGESRGWVTFNGDSMPLYGEQSLEIQEAWNAAAQAVAAVVLGDWVE